MFIVLCSSSLLRVRIVDPGLLLFFFVVVFGHPDGSIHVFLFSFDSFFCNEILAIKSLVSYFGAQFLRQLIE